MLNVAQLLSRKTAAGDGLSAWTIQPYASVYDAIRAMAERDVGALVVADGDKPVGIVSERDYARKGILRRRFALDTLVADIMTTPLVSIEPGDTMTTCMERMVSHGIRHLPVIEDGRLLGMVSIGDVLEALLDESVHGEEGGTKGLRGAAR